MSPHYYIIPPNSIYVYIPFLTWCYYGWINYSYSLSSSICGLDLILIHSSFQDSPTLLLHYYYYFPFLVDQHILFCIFSHFKKSTLYPLEGLPIKLLFAVKLSVLIFSPISPIYLKSTDDLFLLNALESCSLNIWLIWHGWSLPETCLYLASRTPYFHSFLIHWHGLLSPLSQCQCCILGNYLTFFPLLSYYFL